MSPTSRCVNPSTSKSRKTGAAAGIQVLHARLEREPQRVVGGRRRGLAEGIRRRLQARFDGAAAALSQHVVTGVDEHPVDPGGEARGSAEGARSAVHLQEALLDRVLRVGEVPEQVRRDALHARPVHLVEALEGRDIPRPAFFEKPLLVVPRSARAIRIRQIPLLRRKKDRRTIPHWRLSLHLFSTSSTL